MQNTLTYNQQAFSEVPTPFSFFQLPQKLSESDSELPLDDLDLSYGKIQNFLEIDDELISEITQIPKENFGEIKILDFGKRKNTCFKLQKITGLEQCLLTEQLKLNCHFLQTIENITTMTHLKCLNLSHNQIQIISGIFKLKSLQDLDLSYNKIEIIPEEMGELKHLQFLNLSSNKIENFQNVMSLRECGMLRILKLTKNPIEFSGLVKQLCPQIKNINGKTSGTSFKSIIEIIQKESDSQQQIEILRAKSLIQQKEIDTLKLQVQKFKQQNDENIEAGCHTEKKNSLLRQLSEEKEKYFLDVIEQMMRVSTSVNELNKDNQEMLRRQQLKVKMGIIDNQIGLKHIESLVLTQRTQDLKSEFKIQKEKISLVQVEGILRQKLSEVQRFQKEKEQMKEHLSDLVKKIGSTEKFLEEQDHKMGRDAYLRNRSLKKNKLDYVSAKEEIEEILEEITHKIIILQQQIIELELQQKDIQHNNKEKNLQIKNRVFEEILSDYQGRIKEITERIQDLKDQNIILESKFSQIKFVEIQSKSNPENLIQLVNTLKDMKQLVTSSLIRQQDVNSENQQNMIQSEKKLKENMNIQNIQFFADGILGLLLEMSVNKPAKDKNQNLILLQDQREDLIKDCQQLENEIQQNQEIIKLIPKTLKEMIGMFKNDEVFQNNIQKSIQQQGQLSAIECNSLYLEKLLCYLKEELVKIESFQEVKSQYIKEFESETTQLSNNWKQFEEKKLAFKKYQEDINLQKEEINEREIQMEESKSTLQQSAIKLRKINKTFESKKKVQRGLDLEISSLQKQVSDYMQFIIHIILSKVKNLQNTFEKHKSRNSDIEKESQESINLLTVSKRKHVKLKKEIQSLRIEKVEIKKQEMEIQKGVTIMRESYEKEHFDYVSSQQRYQLMSEKFMAVKEQFTQASQQYQNLQTQNQQFSKKNQKLKYKIKEREKHLEKIDDILGELQQEKFDHTEQQEKYEETQQLLEALGEEIQGIELQREIVEAKLKAAEEHLASRESLISLKQTELEELKRKKQEIEAGNEHVREEKVKFEAKVEYFREQLGDFKNVKNEVLDIIEKLQEKQRDLDDDIQAREQYLLKIKEDINMLLQESENLKLLHVEEKTQLKQVQNEICEKEKEVQKELSEKESHLQQIIVDYEEIFQELQEKQKEFEVLQVQTSKKDLYQKELSENIKKLDAILEQKKKNIAQFESFEGKKVEEVGNIQKDIEFLDKIHKRLEKENKDLQLQSKGIEKRINQAAAKEDSVLVLMALQGDQLSVEQQKKISDMANSQFQLITVQKKLQELQALQKNQPISPLKCKDKLQQYQSRSVQKSREKNLKDLLFDNQSTPIFESVQDLFEIQRQTDRSADEKSMIIEQLDSVMLDIERMKRKEVKK